MIRDFNECLGELNSWQDEAIKVTNARTEAIARLWKFFSFPVDFIESVYDFYRGDISLAFQYLNEQARGLVQELPQCPPSGFVDLPEPSRMCKHDQPMIIVNRRGWETGMLARVTSPWSKLYGREFKIRSFNYDYNGGTGVTIDGPQGNLITLHIGNYEIIKE